MPKRPPLLVPARPLGTFIEARVLAEHLRTTPGRVNHLLRQLVKRWPMCRTEIVQPWHGEPHFVYRLSVIWSAVERWARGEQP